MIIILNIHYIEHYLDISLYTYMIYIYIHNLNILYFTDQCAVYYNSAVIVSVSKKLFSNIYIYEYQIR